MPTSKKINVVSLADVEQAERDLVDIVKADIAHNTPDYELAKGVQMTLKTMRSLSSSTDLPYELITAYKSKTLFRKPRVKASDLETFDATIQLITESIHDVLEYSDMDSRSKAFVFKVVVQALTNIGGNHG